MSVNNGNDIYNNGLTEADVQSIIDNTPNIKNVQSDWNETSNTNDAFIKNKPYYTKSQTSVGSFKICTFPQLPNDSERCLGINFTCVKGFGGISGTILYKNGFKVYIKYCNSPWTGSKTVNLKYVVNNDNTVTLYALTVGYHVSFKASPLINLPKNEVDFTEFGVNTTIPETAVDIQFNFIANSSSDSGVAPVKINGYGDLTPVTMDNYPTKNSTGLVNSGKLYDVFTDDNGDQMTETPPQQVYVTGKFYFVAGKICRCTAYSNAAATFDVYGIVEALNYVLSQT